MFKLEVQDQVLTVPASENPLEAVFPSDLVFNPFTMLTL